MRQELRAGLQWWGNLRWGVDNETSLLPRTWLQYQLAPRKPWAPTPLLRPRSCSPSAAARPSIPA